MCKYISRTTTIQVALCDNVGHTCCKSIFFSSVIKPLLFTICLFILFFYGTLLHIAVLFYIAESVGPDNVEGFSRVEELANYLCSLYDQSMALTNNQACTIYGATKLHMTSVLQARYKAESPKGRFMRKKGTDVAEGVEQTRRKTGNLIYSQLFH